MFQRRLFFKILYARGRLHTQVLNTKARNLQMKLTFAHTVPAQKSNISQKNDWGKSLTFSFLKIIRRLLLFVRLSYYFTPVLGSQSLPRSSRLPFWPAGFILPPIIENLLIYFFRYGPFGGGVCQDWMNQIELHIKVLDAIDEGLYMLYIQGEFYESLTKQARAGIGDIWIQENVNIPQATFYQSQVKLGQVRSVTHSFTRV